MAGKRIIIVSYQFSVVMRSVEKRLTEAGHFITSIQPKLADVEGYIKDAGMFIIYLPPEITETRNVNSLFRIAESLDRAKSKVLLIGEKKFYDELMTAIPLLQNYVWMNRPLDMDVLAKSVEDILKGDVHVATGKRILIIDDDPAYARMVKEWLKDSYKVDIVTDGMQGIKFLLGAPVDIILLDYEMPVVDGPQVLEMLRSEETTKNIPVIFLTGVGTKDAVARVMALHPTGYVLKSTNKVELLKYLQDKIPVR